MVGLHKQTADFMCITFCSIFKALSLTKIYKRVYIYKHMHMKQLQSGWLNGWSLNVIPVADTKNFQANSTLVHTGIFWYHFTLNQNFELEESRREECPWYTVYIFFWDNLFTSKRNHSYHLTWYNTAYKFVQLEKQRYIFQHLMGRKRKEKASTYCQHMSYPSRKKTAA
jgi:hypothetical protein